MREGLPLKRLWGLTKNGGRMLKRYTSLFFLVTASFLLITGCATTGKKSDLETQALRNQVSVLETRLKEKDQEIYNLKETLNSSEQANTKQVSRAVSFKVKAKATNKNIQVALKNAGYDIGVIDGKMGKNTREAIKVFQKANNLKADGMVGKKTWELLAPYLQKK